MAFIINAVHLAALGLTLIIFADIIASYFMSHFHPIRRTLDSIVQPMLAPIRRLLPPVGVFDFSPFVLIIVIKLIETILVRLLI